MSLESKYFKHDFYYNAAKVDKFVAIVQESISRPERQRAFKDVIFRMMKDVVNKNIFNYLNLIDSINGLEEKPTRDELISDCFLVFDRCLTKYKTGAGYNFYFFLNTSLSRYFYRNYQHSMKHVNNTVEISDVMETVNSAFHTSGDGNTMELLLDNLGFDETERRIAKSRLSGQKTAEFLKQNTDITNAQYSQTLKAIKVKLQSYKEAGEI